MFCCCCCCFIFMLGREEWTCPTFLFYTVDRRSQYSTLNQDNQITIQDVTIFALLFPFSVCLFFVVFFPDSINTPSTIFSLFLFLVLPRRHVYCLECCLCFLGSDSRYWLLVFVWRQHVVIHEWVSEWDVSQWVCRWLLGEQACHEHYLTCALKVFERSILNCICVDFFII